MAIYRFRRGTYAEGMASKKILQPGEGAYEIDTGRFKIGNGVDLYPDLPYYIDEDGIEEAVEEALLNSPGAGVTPEMLNNHIDSPTPHPAYDDGPSFALLYENAKV